MTGRHRHADVQAMYTFGESLKNEADRIATLANGLRVLATQAAESQPTGDHLAGDMTETADRVGKAAKRVEGLYAMWRTGHARDIERVENPRKSKDAESRADVGRAIRDV